MFSQWNPVNSFSEQSSSTFLQNMVIKGVIVHNPRNQSLQAMPTFPGSQDDDWLITHGEHEQRSHMLKKQIDKMRKNESMIDSDWSTWFCNI